MWRESAVLEVPLRPRRPDAAIDVLAVDVAVSPVISCPTSIDEQLADLAQLQPGWLDGDGEAVSAGVLSLARSALECLAAGGAPVPYLYPTPSGGVRAEFATEPDDCWDVVVEVSFDAPGPAILWLRAFAVGGSNEWDRGYSPWLLDALCIDAERFLRPRSQHVGVG